MALWLLAADFFLVLPCLFSYWCVKWILCTFVVTFFWEKWDCCLAFFFGGGGVCGGARGEVVLHSSVTSCQLQLIFFTCKFQFKLLYGLFAKLIFLSSLTCTGAEAWLSQMSL